MAGGQRRLGVRPSGRRIITTNRELGGRCVDLLVLFVDICLFKRGPQDVPASRLLFGMALVAYLVVGEILLIVQSDWFEAALQAAVEAMLLLGLCWLALSLFGRQARYLQTATALLATDAVISTPGALVLQWWTARPDVRLFQMALFMLMIWHIMVVAHILRHALSRALHYGLALAVLYIVISYQIMSALFGAS